MPYGQTIPERLRTALANQTHLPVTQIFRRLEMIGKGAYGSVHKAVHVETGMVVALKIVDFDQPEDDIDDIQREVTLLSELHGSERSNITGYYGSWMDGPRIWIAMDLAQGGSIRTLMKSSKGGVIEERYVVVIMREILIALSYLHHANVIHRDLKAANVLLTSAGRILLCDFGVSARLAYSHSKRTTFVGTPYWMAPEVIRPQSQYDTKADIWSLGITLYEMVTGAPPHAKEDQMRALIIIPQAAPPRLPENVGSKDMRDFTAVMLKELPVERPTADDLSKHKWIKAAAKTPLSVLRELIVQYQAWVDQGGVRQSLAGDLPWEDQEDQIDPPEGNPWSFDTMRSLPDNTSYEYDDEKTPVERYQVQVQPPPSLRGIFEQALPRDEAVRTPVRRVAVSNTAPPEIAEPQQRIEIPDLNQLNSPPVFSEIGDAQTARPSDFVFPRNGTNAESPPLTNDQFSGPSKGSYRDVGRKRGVDQISIPRRGPSQSSAFTDSERETPTQMRRVFSDDDNRSSSPQRVRRNGVSPANFTFPANPGAQASSLSNSSPVNSQSPSASGHTPTVSSDDSNHLPTLNIPPSRSHSANPYIPSDNTGFVRPPLPQPIRQQSTSALEPPRARPLRSGSTSAQMEGAGSTLAVPEPSALRKALNLSFVPETGLGIDMLPPSPSAISPHRNFVPAPSNLGPNGATGELSSSLSANGHLETPLLRSFDEGVNGTRSFSQSPPLTNGFTGPMVRPLDYSRLGTSDAVHSELSQTVADLAQWLEVIDTGLTNILSPRNFETTDDVVDQYSTESPIYQSEG